MLIIIPTTERLSSINLILHLKSLQTVPLSLRRHYGAESYKLLKL